MCFVWIWEQTAIISLYSINWLVFITETESFYCAVRTGSLYIIQVMCFMWISEQTAIISLYNINWLVFTTETECAYCAVRTGSLNAVLVKFSLQEPCHGSDGWSPTSHRGGTVSIPGHFIWELCWIVSLGHVFRPVHPSPLIIIPYSIFLYMLLLPDWQTGKAWEPSKSNAFSVIEALLKGMITITWRLGAVGI